MNPVRKQLIPIGSDSAAGIPVTLRWRDRLSVLLQGDETKARVLRGSFWSIAGYGVSQSLRLISNLVLTRLLMPEAFGLMAIVSVFIQGLAMLSDLGTEAAIVQNKDGQDEKFLCTAWTIQVVRGFLLFVIACLIAWPVSVLYEQPILFPMVAVTGLSTLITGFQTTAISVYQRNLWFYRPFLVQLITSLLNLAIVVALSFWLRNVWALVIGTVISSVITTVAGYAILPGIKHRFQIDRTAASHIIKFGKWLFLASAATFLASRADRLFLGKMIPLESLGLYSIAAMIADLPAAIALMLSAKVFFPAFSELRSDDDRFIAAYGRVQTTWLTTILLMTTALVLICGPAVTTLYDERYWSLIPVLRVLLFGTFFGAITKLSNSVLLAKGHSFSSGLKSMINLVVTPFAIWVGFQSFGLVGVAAATCFSRAVVALSMSAFLWYCGIRAVGKDIMWISLGALGTVLVMIV